MKPGKNDPCSCGSGKKYKHCCAKKAAAGSAAPSPAELKPLIALHNDKRFGELETKALALVNRYPNAGHDRNFGLAWKLLGISQRRQGKNALEAFQRTVALLPADADAHTNLGVIQNELGAFEQAITSFKKALSIQPDSSTTLNNLGTALRFSGKLDEALSIYRRALQADPNSAHIHFNLGTTLKELSQPDQALASYRKVIALKPDSAEAYCNLCSILQILGKLDAALESGRQAIKLNPRLAEAHSNLGYVLKDLGQHDAAMECFRQAISANPAYAKVHGNIAGLYEKLGQIDQAIASFRRSLEIQPDLATYSGLLFSLNYSTNYTPTEYLSEAEKFGQMTNDNVSSRFDSWQCEAQPNRLRVGMVSGDFRNHSVGHFLVGFLSHIDPDRVELIAYPTHSQEDEVTERIRPSFSQWHPLYGKSDEDAARLIHDDGIHVLMDISGHTAFNRLPVFAWKPAPVQVTWLGLPNTTGVSEIDYLLGDVQAIPQTIESYFSETIWRMPESYLCFSAPVPSVNVSPLPAQSAGHVTFGSFNNLTKMNDEVVELWSRILLSVPNSRLYLKTGQLDSEDICETTRSRFLKHGITPERLLLKGKTSSAAKHLAEYNKIDIALDPFPYHGTTTSIEAMWMGVPVLTLHGDRFMSLTAKSVAHYSGLPDWVASDKDDCVSKAVSFTSDLDHLSSLRAGLREKVLASSLFDASRFAKNLEEALFGMWQAGANLSHMTRNS